MTALQDANLALQADLLSAQAELQRNGYQTFTTALGNLYVKDPEHRSGPGGMLEFTGFKNIHIKDYRQALQFIDVRS